MKCSSDILITCRPRKTTSANADSATEQQRSATSGGTFAGSELFGDASAVPLLTTTSRGLYCETGDFHVDPWRAVDRALITHAHADHARSGSGRYLCARPGRGVLQARLGKAAVIESLPYGETTRVNGVTVSFHPAGHVLGSAQIRLEHQGEAWVVSGDYKTEPDPTCESFESIRCHTFITESTFGLPVYQWPASSGTIAAIHDWWRGNQDRQRTSVLFAYSLGKAQRILAQLDASTGPVFVHDAVAKLLPHYEAEGVRFPAVQRAGGESMRAAKGRALVIAPPGAEDSKWLREFGEASTAFASGWMLVRGARRWRAADRGFVISDHADWRGLNESIRATGAGRVLVTHGYSTAMVRWLREQGFDADTLKTRFEGEPASAE